MKPVFTPEDFNPILATKSLADECNARVEPLLRAYECLREALEFYANHGTYSCKTIIETPPLDADAYGNKARTALAEVERILSLKKDKTDLSRKEDKHG